MKDSLNHLLRDRFQGHEAPVDPAIWQVIEARLLTGAPANDDVSDLFRQRFQQHEMHVDPAVWQGISSQLGHSAAAGGLLGGYGWIAAGVAGLVVAGGLYLGLKEDTTMIADIAPVNEQVVEASSAPDPLPQEGSGTVFLPATAEPIALEAASRSNEITAPNNPVEGPMIVPAPEETQADGTSSGADQSQPQDSFPEVVNLILSEVSDQIRSAPVTAQPEPGMQSAGPTTDGQPSETIDTEPTSEEPAPTRVLFLPNTFTPNGDGYNDEYRVEPSVAYSLMHMRVFSLKTNQMVFSTNSGEAWTGAGCEDGWYSVAVEVMTLDGGVLSEGKVVWLNRQGMN